MHPALVRLDITESAIGVSFLGVEKVGRREVRVWRRREPGVQKRGERDTVGMIRGLDEGPIRGQHSWVWRCRIRFGAERVTRD